MPVMDWQRYRELIPRRAGQINLNAGTLSPTPRPVMEATSRLREEMAINGTYFFWHQLPPLLETARARLGTFLNVGTERLLLLPNVTFAMNLAIAALPVGEGDEILTTDQCYGAMRLALEQKAKATGAAVRSVTLPAEPQSPEEIVEAIAAGIAARTRVLFFDHVTSPTGLVLPAVELCALAREHGLWSVVDGAHGPGLVDVDLTAMNADFYGANCHKWMMSAPGAGFLHASERGAERMTPLVVSWGSAYDPDHHHADSGWGGSMWQRSFEYHGVTDRCPQATIPAALDLREEIGEANIRARIAELTTYARSRLADAGVRCVSPRDPRMTAAMLCFEYEPTNPLADQPWRNAPWFERGIICPINRVGDRTVFRVSCAWFNTEEEIDALADVIRAGG